MTTFERVQWPLLTCCKVWWHNDPCTLSKPQHICTLQGSHICMHGVCNCLCILHTGLHMATAVLWQKCKKCTRSTVRDCVPGSGAAIMSCVVCSLYGLQLAEYSSHIANLDMSSSPLNACKCAWPGCTSHGDWWHATWDNTIPWQLGSSNWSTFGDQQRANRQSSWKIVWGSAGSNNKYRSSRMMQAIDREVALNCNAIGWHSMRLDG